jgi:hypothetical protein
MTEASPVDLDSTPKQMVLAIVRNLPDGVTAGRDRLHRLRAPEGDAGSPSHRGRRRVVTRRSEGADEAMAATGYLTPTPKASVIEALSHLPDDATYEDILYHVEMLEGLDLSEQDSREGRVITHDEFKERVKQWLSPKT